MESCQGSQDSRLKSREVEAMLYGLHFLFKKLGTYVVPKNVY